MKLLLTDYKGKYSVIQDEDKVDDVFDVVIGEISREDAIKEAPERCGACLYYGIPPIITSDKELSEIYDKFTDVALREDEKV